MYLHSSKLNKSHQALLVLILLATCYLLLAVPVFALDETSQQILDLRKQIEELTKQAEQYKGTIAEKQKQANTLKQQIDILNSQIVQLQLKITITDRRITSTNYEINDLHGQIFDTVEKINQQKQAIGELITILYEQDKLSLLAVLLKSSRLSDFANEAQQVESLNNKLTGLLTQLKIEKEALEQNRQNLEVKKSELETLNDKQINQKSSLNGTKNSKDTLLIQTKGQEAKYQQLLNEAEKKKAQFFAELQELEAEALKTGAFIVHVTATSIPPRGSKIFKWPYDDYYLTQNFGMTAYARRGDCGGSPHNGIDIASGPGSAIHPIGAGNVLASGFNNGWGNWVAVRHENNMVSLYGHMQAPSGLANGTPVTTSSIIGYEGSTGNATGSHLHLSLYRDFFTYINEKNGQLYFNYFDGTLNPIDYL